MGFCNVSQLVLSNFVAQVDKKITIKSNLPTSGHITVSHTKQGRSNPQSEQSFFCKKLTCILGTET